MLRTYEKPSRPGDLNLWLSRDQSEGRLYALARWKDLILLPISWHESSLKSETKTKPNHEKADSPLEAGETILQKQALYLKDAEAT